MFLVEVFISSLAICIFSLYLSSNFFGKKIHLKNKKNIFGILFLIITIPIVYFSFYNFIKVVINCTIFSLTYKIIFNEKIAKCFFVGFITVVYFFISEIIFSLILIFVLSIDATSLTDHWSGSIIANFLISFISFLIFKIKFITNYLKNLIRKYKKEGFNEIIFITIFAIGVLSNKNVLFFGINLTYILNILMVIMFSIIIFYFIKEKEFSNKMSVKYEQLFNYVQKYEKELNKKSMTIHEFKNQIIAIKGFLNDSNKDLKNYIDSIFNDLKHSESKILNDMKNIPKGGLKGLLYYKLSDLSENNIKVYIKVSEKMKRSDFDKINTNTYKDIIKIVGVYLDNAIEGTRNGNNKQIMIEIFIENEEFNLVVSNTYHEKIKKYNLDNIGYSTKGKGRGYGLALVSEIISKNNLITQQRIIDDKYYIVHLKVKLKNIP